MPQARAGACFCFVFMVISLLKFIASSGDEKSVWSSRMAGKMRPHQAARLGMPSMKRRKSARGIGRAIR